MPEISLSTFRTNLSLVSSFFFWGGGKFNEGFGFHYIVVVFLHLNAACFTGWQQVVHIVIWVIIKVSIKR
ncbi:hypothetical protein FKM82_014444 [Ascaphus truei]